MNSNYVIVSRDEKFMEDTLEGGRSGRNNEVVVENDDEETDYIYQKNRLQLIMLVETDNPQLICRRFDFG